MCDEASRRPVLQDNADPTFLMPFNRLASRCLTPESLGACGDQSEAKVDAEVGLGREGSLAHERCFKFGHHVGGGLGRPGGASGGGIAGGVVVPPAGAAVGWGSC